MAKKENKLLKKQGEKVVFVKNKIEIIDEKSKKIDEEKIDEKESEKSEEEQLDDLFSDSVDLGEQDNFSSFDSARSRPINPFLESNLNQEVPITNLEQGLGNIPTENKKAGEEQSLLYNAPQYGSNYNSNSYDSRRAPTDIQVDITNGALMGNFRTETRNVTPQERTLDFGRWQRDSGMGSMQGDRSQPRENYTIAPQRLEQDTSLPFQDKKEKRFRF
jgi:hypothetical protein